MTHERRIGLGLLITGVIGFLVVVAIVVASNAGALKYTLVFEDAKGLQKGDKVQLNGVDIGTVKSVKLISTEPPRVDVIVRIDGAQAPKVRSDSTAVISNVSLPNVSGQKVVEILNPTGDGAVPMQNGTEIRGQSSLLELQIWKVRHKLGSAAEDLSEKLGEAAGSIKESSGPVAQKLREQSSEWSKKLKDAGKEMRESAKNPEVRELSQKIMERLNQFVEEMRTKGLTAIDQLLAQWQKIKAEIGPMLDKLRELGQKYLVDTYRQIMNEIDETLNSHRPNATPTPQPTTTP